MSHTVDTLIVGAGFSGLCMAIKLLQAGHQSFLLIEQSDDIGGTWHFNRYPGCACDIPSHLYSFSFERNPEWSRMFAGRREIHAYLTACAQRYGVLPHVRLRTALRQAVWDEDAAMWHAATTSEGCGFQIDARFLVLSVGGLHAPSYPTLNGVEKFVGQSFHSSLWDASSVEFEGKKVAVIGTGASAIQFVPEIAPHTRILYVFQRTPAWIVPKSDFEISERWKKIFRHLPIVGWIFRTFLFWRHEIGLQSFIRLRGIRKRAEKMVREYLEKEIPDPKLRAAVTPNYEVGCKRVLFSNNFYSTLQRPNVELVTVGISEVREQSLVTQDGEERMVDMIIYGTGFRLTGTLHKIQIVGRGGLELKEAWRDRVSAFMGVTVSGFPNLFFILGPNSAVGHNSVILMVEAQVGYVMSCLEELISLRRRGRKAAMEVRASRQESFQEFLRQRFRGSVWQAGGCRSWYQDSKTGENIALWPCSVVDYIRRTHSVSLADYQLSG